MDNSLFWTVSAPGSAADLEGGGLLNDSRRGGLLLANLWYGATFPPARGNFMDSLCIPHSNKFLDVPLYSLSKKHKCGKSPCVYP